MNKVFLKGNVGNDPKITTFPDGGKVAQFSLATTEKGFKTKDGRDVPEETQWHNIVVKKSGLSGVVEQYVKKGMPLLVVGKIKSRSYEAGGETRFITEVVVDEMELLGSQKREQAPAPEPDGYSPLDDNDFPIGYASR